MKVDGKTKVCGLIGNPVEHTMSPTIHNTVAKTEGDNMIYVPFLVTKNLDEAVAGAHACHIHGMNVTVPHKSDVMNALCEIDDEAKLIGAVNTLVYREKGYKGYNTDLMGLERALQSDGITFSGKKVIVIGAGGAARAAVFLSALRGASKIIILNRTIEKAERIKQEIIEKTGFDRITALSINDWKKIQDEGYLVLQATKVGMHPNSEVSPIEEAEFFDKADYCFDLIYTPFETKFMKLASMRGKAAQNGLKMLLYQGIAAYELWFQKKVSQEAIDQAYGELLKNFVKQKNIILTGFMGCGKTSVGMRLADTLGISFLDTDKIIEEQQNMSISDIFAKKGEGAFRKMETECLKELLSKKDGAPFVLSVGGGLPIREENRELLKQIGKVIYLKVTPETVFKRLHHDTTRPLLQGENPRGRIMDLMRARERFYEAGADLILLTDEMDFETIIAAITGSKR